MTTTTHTSKITIQQARKLYKKHEMEVAGDNDTHLLYYGARKEEEMFAEVGMDRTYEDKFLSLVVDTDSQTAEVSVHAEVRHVRGVADFPAGCSLHS